MTASDLLAHLARLGVMVTRTGTDVVFLDAPQGVIDTELLRIITEMKPKLLERLSLPMADDHPPVAAGDDGRRVWIRAMGVLLGWPRLPLGRNEAILGGEPAWMAFTSIRASTELVDRAVTVLLAIDDAGAGLP
jgi:hypothetical protein